MRPEALNQSMIGGNVSIPGRPNGQWASRLLPWLFSVSVHVAVVLAAVVAVWPVKTRPQLEPVEIEMVDRNDSGSLPDSDWESLPEQVTTMPSSAYEVSLAGQRRWAEYAAESVVGVAAREQDARGTAAGDSGSGAQGESAERLLFVLDATGSTLGQFGWLLLAIKQDLLTLREDQQFAVMMISHQQTWRWPGDQRLQSGGRANGRQAIDWLDEVVRLHATAGFAGSLLAGIESAVRLEADVVRVYSDTGRPSARYEASRADVERCIEWAKKNDTRVDFLLSDEFMADGHAASIKPPDWIQILTKQTGGQWRSRAH